MAGFLDNRKKGALLLVASTFSIALSAALVHLAGDLPTLQKQFLRSLVMILFSLSTVVNHRSDLKIKKEYALPLILRGVFGALSVVCHFYSIDRLALADANMLNKLSPFFTIFFSWLLLKESMKLRDILAILAAFSGMLLIIKPGGDSLQFIPALVGVLGGVLAGIAFTYVRASNQAGAPKITIVLSFSICCLLVAAPSTLIDFAPMSSRQWIVMLLCGLCATVGHFCNTRAYAYAPSSQISVFDYCQVLFSAILGFFMFGQTPDFLSVAGYFIIIGTGILVFLGKTKK